MRTAGKMDGTGLEENKHAPLGLFMIAEKFLAFIPALGSQIYAFS